jgi:hypothetical protein
VSVLENTGDDDSPNRTYIRTAHESPKNMEKQNDHLHTWVATYAIEGRVTCVIPWMRALPDRVALGSFSTELGDVKICL